MTHLKRINAPKSWPIERKVKKFIIRPLPGPHKITESMPLGVILREILKLGKKDRDNHIILNNKEVLVNNKVIINSKFPVGILDTLSIPSLNKYYRMMYTLRGKLNLEDIPKEESNNQICKIIGKTILKKGKIQLNLYNSTNIIVEKDVYKVKDTLILKDNKITKHLKFEKDAFVYLIGGKHMGHKAKVIDFKKYPGFSKDIITIKINEEIHETLSDYAYVIEK